jgi:hypothetical protein
MPQSPSSPPTGMIDDTVLEEESTEAWPFAPYAAGSAQSWPNSR